MKVNIDGIKYDLIFVNPLNMGLADGVAYGSVSHSNQIIYISNQLSGLKLKQVLIHEITHAYLERYYHRYEKYDEEDVCSMFGLHAEKVVNLVNIILEKRKEREQENEKKICVD